MNKKKKKGKNNKNIRGGRGFPFVRLTSGYIYLFMYFISNTYLYTRKYTRMDGVETRTLRHLKTRTTEIKYNNNKIRMRPKCASAVYNIRKKKKKRVEMKRKTVTAESNIISNGRPQTSLCRINRTTLHNNVKYRYLFVLHLLWFLGPRAGDVFREGVGTGHRISRGASVSLKTS